MFKRHNKANNYLRNYLEKIIYKLVNRLTSAYVAETRLDTSVTKCLRNNLIGCFENNCKKILLAKDRSEQIRTELDIE